MGTVERSIAVNDVNSWLDYKKVSPSKRQANEQSIETMVNAIEDGDLVVNEDKTLTLTLKIPVTGEVKFDTLVFQPRIPVETLHNSLGGVKATDVDARLLAHVSALTSKGKALIKKLDTEDYDVARAIATFFL